MSRDGTLGILRQKVRKGNWTKGPLNIYLCRMTERTGRGGVEIMEMEERLKKIKKLVLREVERAAKNGNTASIVKNAEILKKGEQLIKALDQIKTQMKGLEEQIQVASPSNLRVGEEEKTEKFPPKAIQEDVPSEMDTKTDDNGTTSEEPDFEGGKVSEDELKDFFSTHLAEKDLLEPAVSKG
jgi:hypothetical protein